MGSISVNDAIKKGRLQLFWIPILIFLGTLGLCCLVFLNFIAGDIIWLNIVCTIATFLLPVFLCLSYYFLMLPRWRIWAFTHVRNVHELKHLAKLCKIYPEDKSYQWRLEIKSDEQKRQIEELQRKFEQPDIFEDDYTLPYETSYSYSKIENVIYLIVTLALVVTGLVFLFQGDLFAGLIMLGGSLIFGATIYKRLKANGPALLISNDGITTQDNGFHQWQDIQNEQIFYVSAGKSSYYGLSYDIDGNTIKMSLKELTGLSSYKIDHVLRTYRGRYETTKRPIGVKVPERLF